MEAIYHVLDHGVDISTPENFFLGCGLCKDLVEYHLFALTLLSSRWIAVDLV